MSSRPVVSDRIKSLPRYQAGMSPKTLLAERGISGAVKLSSNENDFGPSPSVREALLHAMEELHVYPLPSGGTLRTALVDSLGVPTEQLILGNGSDEIIDLMFRALTEPGDHVVGSEATFFRYKIASRVQDLHFHAAPCKDRYFHDLQAIADLALEKNARVVVLVNPSNPTGTWFTHDELAAFFARIPRETIVVMDEAYIEFADAADFPRSEEFLATHPNLLIQRTFSKAYGLAAIRVGYGIGGEAIIEAMENVRAPFSVNSLAHAAAEAALADQDHMKMVTEHNAAERIRVAKAVEAMGIKVVPSQANFLLLDCGRNGLDVYEGLLQRGVIVRPLVPYGFTEHIRVTMSLREHNDRFLAALEEVMALQPA